MIQKINKFQPASNSFKKTFCVFDEKELTEISDLSIDFESESGSCYYYTQSGMYRYSNHWGRLANSKWRLVEQGLNEKSKFKLGYANWEDFYPDDEMGKWYYLEFNQARKEVSYQHKNNPNFDNRPVLRNTKETQKRIKQARNILNLTNWAKYFENQNIDELRVIIINQLIFTNKTLEDIKKEIYGQK